MTTAKVDFLGTEFSAIHSVEGFLTHEEVAAVTSALDSVIDTSSDGCDIARAPELSVHYIPGYTPEDIVNIFEPASRRELRFLPDEVVEILDTASNRAMDRIRSVFPSVEETGPWIYVEYGPGQYVTPHVDYPNDPDNPGLVKYAAISVTLQQAADGGEFFVETISDSNHRDSEGRVVRDLHWGDSRFRSRSRTRWLVRPEVGDAVLWGTEVCHGTKPVRQGCARKLIAFVQTGRSVSQGEL